MNFKWPTFSNRVFTEGTCKLLNLVVTDLVDEDFVLNHRKQAVSALMFGTLAFFSKPGQTFAPIIGTALLSFYTGQSLNNFLMFSDKQSMPFSTAGQDVFNARNNMETSSMVGNSLHLPNYQEGVFSLLIIVPIFCSVLQLISWHFFDLHGKRLDLVKSLRANLRLTPIV